MKATFGFAIALIASTLLAANPAAAKPGNGHGNGKGGGPKWERPGDGGRGPHGDNGPDVNIGIHIGDSDIRVIHDYYVEHHYAPEPLPPGIAKNLARGKPLPPGIAKRHMAPELVGRLLPRENCDWMLVGSNAVLVERHSGIVVDIAVDIF